MPGGHRVDGKPERGALGECESICGSKDFLPFSDARHWSHVTRHFSGPGGFSAFLDICELQVDRGDGKGFVALAFDTTPGYVDTQPFPTSPVKWTYQAIYRVGDSRVGQWSKPVSVTVGG